MHPRQRIPFRGALVASAIALAASTAGAQAQTYNFRVVHEFDSPDDGLAPSAPVRFDAAGNLFGTTTSGGAYGAGTIFKIAKDGTETVLHSFDGTTGGDGPSGPVTIDPATGDLYGATGGGGEGCSNGCGLLYKLSSTGTFTVLHRFDGTSDGRGPSGPLLLDEQGNLYGTAIYGALDSEGNNGNGTVFKYGADGSFTVLHAFTGSDGLNPSDGVVSDGAGNLYGTTLSNYTNGPDAPPSIYKLSPDGTLTTLYWFDQSGDGTPGGLIGDAAGNLYGTSYNGGANYTGMVFKLAPDGVFTRLHEFTDDAGGIYPQSDLLLIGRNLYGVTNRGGDRRCHIFPKGGCGTAFKLASDGAYTVLHAFGQSGGFPYAGMTYRYGRLFGTTYMSCNGCLPAGNVYSIGMTK
jgi:uncharacterized repeat protein (TIGR03803 family)